MHLDATLIVSDVFLYVRHFGSQLGQSIVGRNVAPEIGHLRCLGLNIFYVSLYIGSKVNGLRVL